jgi:hypothetical protein
MLAGNRSSLAPVISSVKQTREQLALNAEPAAASAEMLAVEKEEAMGEAYTRVGMDVTRGVRLVSALDNPNSAAAVTGASVSVAVRFHRPQRAGLPTYTPSASHFEWSQQEPHRLRLIPAAG